MKYIVERFRRFCGFITGFIFFVSGILKLLDPVGAGLVMDEYFDFLHVGFLGFAAKPLGTLFALAETVIGTALITGVWRRFTAAAAMGFQGFFTLLTLALVIFNPQMDCGCFGEAIHLTHWETFIKNLIICTLLAAAFLPFRGFGRPRKIKYISFGIVTASVLAFTVYSWIYIPPVDFTDYKPGVMLAASDRISDDMYESWFIYEKDGVREKFDLHSLPDSTWTFVSTETVLKEGAEEPVNISITDEEGEYMDEIIADGEVMVISVYKPDMKEKKWKSIEAFARNAASAGFRPVILTTSQDIKGSDIYYSDYKTLITLNRSNGGVTYFSGGELIGKCAYAAMPDNSKLAELSHDNGLESLMDKDTKGSLGFQGFLLYVFAVMLLL